MARENFSTYTTFKWFYSSRNVSTPTEIWNPGKGFLKLTTFFVLINCIYHATSLVSPRMFVLLFNVLVFPFDSYRSKVIAGFQHHVSVELLLRRIQQYPFFLAELHSHILKGQKLRMRGGSSTRQRLHRPPGNATTDHAVGCRAEPWRALKIRE